MSSGLSDAAVRAGLLPAVVSARRLRAEARLTCKAAAQLRWRVQKEYHRARRLRRSAESELSAHATLDEFMTVASVDELLDVLVLLGGRTDEGPRNDDPPGA